MQHQPKSDHEAARELREARRKCAAASIVRRYEFARQVTGLSTAERVALAAAQRLCLSK